MISIAKRFMLIAVLAIVGTVVIHSAASAQRYTCIFVNGCKVLIILDPCGNIIGTQTDCGSSGSGTFNGPVFPTQGPVPPSTLVAEQINATVQDPVYGAINDAAAVKALRPLFPGRDVVGLRADAILTGGGSFHCISQQIPA